MDTADGITEADLRTMLENSHAHYNLGFTEMGHYQITFQAIGTLTDGDVIESENAGDGYYRVAIDADADGSFETARYFYRMLGGVNGDRMVVLNLLRNHVTSDVHRRHFKMSADGSGMARGVRGMVRIR